MLYKMSDRIEDGQLRIKYLMAYQTQSRVGAFPDAEGLEYSKPQKGKRGSRRLNIYIYRQKCVQSTMAK